MILITIVCFTKEDNKSNQLDVIKSAFIPDTVLIGDLNLDYNKRFDVSYSREGLFEMFDAKLGELNLLQLVKFDTWSRLVGLWC